MQKFSIITLALVLAAFTGIVIPSLTYASGPFQSSTVPSAQLTPELLASLVTIAFSLAFAYLPRVKDWYGALDSEHKAAIMGAVIILVGLGSFGAACGGFIQLEGVACNQAGIVALVQTIIYALLASVGSYTLLVKPFRKPSGDA